MSPSRPSFAARVGRFLRRLVLAGLAALALAVVAGAGAYFYFERDLPSVEELKTYRPPQVSKVHCADGTLCAEFYEERRTWVDLATLPPHVKNAFLAAEDADFYQHEGLDFIGMARAGIKALIPGQRATGASTISQQACRNLLLTQERKLSRKIREWILTPRMERALTKDEILALYINQINFGHGRYGIEEAALFYFGKRAKALTLGEAAVLAGTPQLPHRINPVTNIVKAKRRQKYVLTQLSRHGFLPKAVTDAEMDKPIVLGPRPPPRVGAYYAEEVRKTLVARYGEDAVLRHGLRVDIAMSPKLQAAADEAVKVGLEALDRRQGYRGPVGKLDPQRFAHLRPLIATRIGEAGKREEGEVLVADLRTLAQLHDSAEPRLEEEASEQATVETQALEEESEEPRPSTDETIARAVPIKPLRADDRLVGFVEKVDDAKKVAVIDLVGRRAQLPFASVTWARPRQADRVGPAPSKLSSVVSPGDLIRVRVARIGANGDVEVALDQLPKAQGALLAIDPKTRHVVAMVGGYDFATSTFNRATQAKRQPGSSYKPFLYAAAIDSRRFTAASVVNDAPEAIRDQYTGKLWKPQNYEKSGFEGPMTLRQALTKSKNTVSVRLIEALTPETVKGFAERVGIHSPMPDNLTLALGTGEVTVLEIANAYATLQSLGQYAEPIQIIRVTDSQGRVLEEHQAAFEERIPPPVAYVATSLMRSVVEEGTATAVRELNRPAAGKTGTAQEFRDAWFSGYTTDLVATAWVGFDDPAPLGPGETGGKAALPLWLHFMRIAEQDLPVSDFEVPPGVVQVRIDPSSGLLAGDALPGRVESFLEGTEPTELAPAPGTRTTTDFFLHDSRGGM